MDILIQLIGILGVLASIISFQCKKHRSIMLFRSLNELFFAVQYLLLGAYTGMFMNILSSTRNFIFSKRVADGKKNTVPVIIFSALFLIFGLCTWQGPKSIMVVIAKILSSLAYGNKNPAVIRKITFVTSASWLIYNYSVFSIAGVICEALTLISIIVGIIRLDIFPALQKKKEPTA